ncbi:TRAP transporter large permease subunit [Chelativorans alearense]|uniref:TRAP transporter large permease subunit n=1 Tax=Chelativorans alearense TaxID=2681495 RepID=UPI001969BFF4|nr:TRAP transporter large permease subunit [Chelativorans alearense]
MTIEWYFLLPIALAILMTLLLLGVPIFIAFLSLNVVGTLLMIGPAGYGMLVNSIYSSASSLSLAAIPLFVLMGEVLFRSGSVDVLFDALSKVMGRVKGRLYYFIISLSAVFGALSGSAIAVTAMLGNTALKTMLQRGYDKKLSVSMILAGASLAPIIPPSTMAVVIGSVADVSIAKLLMAGLLPGLLMAIIFAIFIAFSVRANPDLAPADEEVEHVTAREKLAGLAQCLPFGLVIFSVMGFILLGVATATEAAATGVLASLAVAAFYGKLRLRMVIAAVKSAVTVTAVMMVVIVSSTLYTQLLAFSGATSGLVQSITDLPINGLVFTLGVLAVSFAMCMFIDQIAYLLLAVPIFQPIMQSYGIDPVWFWMLFAVFLSIGSNTPPFGYNLFTLNAVADDVNIQTIFSAAWKSVGLVLIGVVIMMLFPALVTFIPSLI